MKKLRIAMIGCGNIANTHLAGYKNVPEAEIVAACDIDPERMKKTCDIYGIPEEHRYTSVEEMLEKEKGNLDAADVCVWNINHAPCAIAALRAGLHVLCEKPMAYNAKDAEEMKAEADKAGKLLMIGFVLRFGDENALVRDFIDAGMMGDIYYSKATYLRQHGNPGGWFGNLELSGGGPVIDLGVHVIDQTRYLMGSPKPVSVFAMVSDKLGNRPDLKNDVAWKPENAKAGDPNTVEDFGTALIRYDNGAVTLLECSYDLNGESVTRKDLYGTKGGVALGASPKFYTNVNGYLSTITPSMENLKGGGNMFTKEMAHFVDCALHGTKCIAPAEDGIWVMKILDAIYESGRTGHEVIIK